MSTKTNCWTFVLLATLFVISFAMLSLPGQVSAARPVTLNSNSCLTCHEDLYYLHDMGKYYCISEHTDRCVNCHEGNAAVMKKDESHLGLSVHPQQDDGAKCQECHSQDTQARLATFAAFGGYKAVTKADPYTPSVDAASKFPNPTAENQIVESLPWLTGAFILLGFWLALVFLSPQKP